MPPLPRVTFGVIVLNGEPFTRYCLRALYPFAHQIVVAEGAAPGAAGIATRDGHSRDGTLAAVREFQALEDPEGKIVLVTAEDEGHPDGFWPGEKDEQSRAYARRATGDYLWQVDVDEFYQPEDMKAILALLRDDPTITAMSFKQLTFWGGMPYRVDGWYLRSGADLYHRLFKWGNGYEYVTHRPPTVHDAQGRDLRRVHWVHGPALVERGIVLYHYSLLLPRQVAEKADYYSRAAWADRARARQWADEVFVGLRRPYRVHNVYDYPSWLEPFTGSHPPQVVAMIADVRAGRCGVELRPTDDIERLLRSRRYRMGRAFLRWLSPLGRALSVWLAWSGRWRRLVRDPAGAFRLWQKWSRRPGAARGGAVEREEDSPG